MMFINRLTKNKAYSIIELRSKFSISWSKYWALLLFSWIFSSSSQAQEKSVHTFDHLVIFNSNPNLQEELNRLFTPAEKLTTVHKHQGTKGDYYLFFNTFIELLSINDSSSLIENQKRFGSPYLQRWQPQTSCPLAFGLNVNPWPDKIDSSNFHRYDSQDSPEEEYYLMSIENSNLDHPLLYWSMPHRAYQQHEDIEAVRANTDPQILDDLLSYLDHPSKVKRLTKIILYLNQEIESQQKTVLQQMEIFDIQKGTNCSMTLIFDHHSQGKTIQIKGKTAVEIRY